MLELSDQPPEDNILAVSVYHAHLLASIANEPNIRIIRLDCLIGRRHRRDTFLERASGHPVNGPDVSVQLPLIGSWNVIGESIRTTCKY